MNKLIELQYTNMYTDKPFGVQISEKFLYTWGYAFLMDTLINAQHIH